jgi:hypothetical protein
MSDFIVTKPFLRGGSRLRRGDPLPAGVDGPTLADYRRLGMVGPAETKPASPGRNTRQPKDKPAEQKPAAPAETQQKVAQAQVDATAPPGEKSAAPEAPDPDQLAAGAEG